MLGGAHVLDAVAPAIGIARDRSHAALKLVADRAAVENQFLAARFRPECFGLIEVNLIPADGGGLQSEIEGGVLICRETYACARLGAIAGSHDLHAVFSGGQFFDSVLTIA